MEERMISYLDTNVVFRLAAGDLEQISDAAKRRIEASDLLISPAVLLELEMLHEIGRLAIAAVEILADLTQKIGLNVCQLPMSAIVASALEIKWTREPGDRLIVANAIANNEAPLISSDRIIRKNYANTIW